MKALSQLKIPKTSNGKMSADICDNMLQKDVSSNVTLDTLALKGLYWLQKWLRQNATLSLLIVVNYQHYTTHLFQLCMLCAQSQLPSTPTSVLFSSVHSFLNQSINQWGHFLPPSPSPQSTCSGWFGAHLNNCHPSMHPSCCCCLISVCTVFQKSDDIFIF